MHKVVLLTHPVVSMKSRILIFKYIIIFLGLLMSAGTLCAQQQGSSYEFIPAPDLWYNDVDGIRTGIRLKGQVPGTFEDGPHRLNLGVWLATWFPDTPVSYYLAFTEPIPGISDYASEGNLRLISQIRTGFSRHGLDFNKRWQQGFEETNYTELSLGLKVQKRFDNEYMQYNLLWQEKGLYLAEMDMVFRNTNTLGEYYARTGITANLAGNAAPFVHGLLEYQQVIKLSDSFAARGRLFAGAVSGNTVPEYRFARSFRSPSGWNMSGFTRAKGTIPTGWMAAGVFQFTGGPNLRGYIDQDFRQLENGLSPLLTSMGSFNIELDYPNPLDKALRKIPVLGELMKLRLYLFFDTGTSLGITDIEEHRVISDAGTGLMFTFNIPDYLGKPRGIMIRYDIPLWLSHPGMETRWKWRNLIGIGAVYNI